jgi:hypothetical protein
MVNVHLSRKSRNVKTGSIPVSTTGSETCPPACPLAGNGCYAGNSHLGMHWRKVTEGKTGSNDWELFCRQIEALPEGQLWRHNQAGDLPGLGNAIDGPKLARLVRANRGRKGFTYTHKPVDVPGNLKAIRDANAKGFTVNLSANNLAHIDELADAAPGLPVVVVLPSEIEGNVRGIESPKGRKVIVCPATYRDDVTCQSCGLCARLRDVVVGFPAHGATRGKASEIAKG